MAIKKALPDLSNFDTLPDSARAALPVVCALFSVSPATVYRRVKAGDLPAPIKDGYCARWIVGDLRKKLATEVQA
jgi:predicted DNA-binding transcriptional regulator AlpA